MHALSLLLVGLAVAQLPADVGIKAPQEVRCHVGQMVVFRAECATRIVWINLSPDVQLHAPVDGKSVAVCVAKPGKFRLAAVTSGKDGLSDPTYVDVLGIGDARPEGKEEPKAPKGKPDPQGASMKLRVKGGWCSATVIGPRRKDGKWDVLTANHCLEKLGDTGDLVLPDGTSEQVTVTAIDGQADLCWAVTDKATLSLPFAVLADTFPATGKGVWHCGHGVDKPHNIEGGSVLVQPDPAGRAWFNLNVSGGDSGAGIFSSATDELVGVVRGSARPGQKTFVVGGTVARARQLRPVMATMRADRPVEMPIPE